MMDSVITDWLTVINNSYVRQVYDIPSDPICDEELLIHKRDSSPRDEESTKGRYRILRMADNVMGSDLYLSAVCLFVCL